MLEILEIINYCGEIPYPIPSSSIIVVKSHTIHYHPILIAMVGRELDPTAAAKNQVLMAIAREAVVQIQDFTEQNLSNTCWAFVPWPWDMSWRVGWLEILF